MPSVDIIDVDDPNIAIEARLSRNIRFSFVARDEDGGKAGDEAAMMVGVIEPRRRRSENGRHAVTAFDFD
jgi:hypothetical protein